MNLWVAPDDELSKARPVTRSTGRALAGYTWTYQPGVIVYMHDTGGDENYRVHMLNVSTGSTRDLTPYPKATSRGRHQSHASGRSADQDERPRFDAA